MTFGTKIVCQKCLIEQHILIYNPDEKLTTIICPQCGERRVLEYLLKLKRRPKNDKRTKRKDTTQTEDKTEINIIDGCVKGGDNLSNEEKGDKKTDKYVGEGEERENKGIGD